MSKSAACRKPIDAIVLIRILIGDSGCTDFCLISTPWWLRRARNPPFLKPLHLSHRR